MSEPSSTSRIKRRHLTSLAVQLGVAGIFVAVIYSGAFSVTEPPAPATELGRKRRLTIDAFDRQGFNVLNADQKVLALKLTAKSLEPRAGGGDR